MDRIMMKNCKKANSQFFLSFFFHFEEQFIFILFFYNCVEFYFYFFETKLRESWKKLFNLVEVEYWMGNLAVKARSWLWYLCGFLAPNYRAFVWSYWIETFTAISLEISQILFFFNVLVTRAFSSFHVWLKENLMISWNHDKIIKIIKLVKKN
jgi:hypothetical protein